MRNLPRLRTSLSTVACVLALAGAMPARAAPASVESIERLLVVTRSESLVASASSNMERTMRDAVMQAGGNRPLTDEQQKSVDAMIVKVAAIVRDELSWDRLKPQYIRLYVETFEQEEVDGLLAFYATPGGQALLTKMPMVLQKMMAMMQGQMQTVMPRIMSTVQESMATLKKEP